jgi:hypothetical protein
MVFPSPDSDLIREPSDSAGRGALTALAGEEAKRGTS